MSLKKKSEEFQGSAEPAYTDPASDYAAATSALNPPVTTENYAPVWDEHVEQVFVASGQKSPINKTYCLTTKSAEQLATILADLRPKIVQSTPYAVAQGSVAFSQTVPWFKFPSGSACNCGLEAAYWGRPGVGAAAEANCRKDLASNETCYAADGDSQYPIELQGPY